MSLCFGRMDSNVEAVETEAAVKGGDVAVVVVTSPGMGHTDMKRPMAPKAWRPAHAEGSATP